MSEGMRDAFIENDVIGNFNRDTAILGMRHRTKTRKKVKKRRAKSVHKRRSKRNHRRKHGHKRKSTRSHGSKIKYTKKGQPYKIMPNGKARFIKK